MLRHISYNLGQYFSGFQSSPNSIISFVGTYRFRTSLIKPSSNASIALILCYLQTFSSRPERGNERVHNLVLRPKVPKLFNLIDQLQNFAGSGRLPAATWMKGMPFLGWPFLLRPAVSLCHKINDSRENIFRLKVVVMPTVPTTMYTPCWHVVLK